jgi:hypothetical protein
MQTYGVEPGQFIYNLVYYYIANNKGGVNNIINDFTGETLDASFIYASNEKTHSFFKALSKHIPNTTPERLISLKKSPFYQYDKNHFILLDLVLELDKCYYQLINDFWFDRVKFEKDANDKHFTIANYRSVIGYFLEHYTDSIIRYCFKNAPHDIIKSFNELKLRLGKDLIELADLYARHNRKVFLAQVKATGLYDYEKFSGDLEKFYKNDREGFFESFGVNQLITSIQNLERVIKEVDDKFPIGKSYRIYPALVLNEKAMQTPLMAQVFQQRFNELLQIINIEKATIHPLTLIHISDLEQMEDHLHKSPESFWELLEYNFRDPKFIPPFYNTLNRKDIKPDYGKPLKLYEELLNRYSENLPKS